MAIQKSKDEAHQRATSLAAKLASYRAQLQEALKGHEESQLEVTQLKSDMASATEKSLHLTNERDQLHSHLLDQGDHLAHLQVATTHVLAQVNALHSLHS